MLTEDQGGPPCDKIAGARVHTFTKPLPWELQRLYDTEKMMNLVNIIIDHVCISKL